MDAEQPAAATAARPVAITVICVIGFLGVLVAVPLAFSQAARLVGAWYPPYLVATALVGLACMIGLWLMRKWAVYTYTALAVINQAVLVVMGGWNVFSLVIPAIVIIVMFMYVGRMR
jgi:hypothetical protein